MKRYVLRSMIYFSLLFIAIISFIPFFTMLVSSTHDNYAITTKVNVLPGQHFLRNYRRLTETLNIWRGFLNSALVASLSTGLGLYFTALAAYAFSKFKFRGRQILFNIVLVAMMIPGQIGIVGFFHQMSSLRLLDSYIPLIIPSVANCFAVFFFKQFIDGALPDSLVESAHIDGAGEWRIYHLIVLPLIKAALVTQAVLSFIGSWNSYMMPLIILRSREKITLPLMIATVRSAYGTDYGAQYVGILISVLPLIFLFSFASKIIMEKVSIGAAIKG